jgi:hypothetical protein
MSLAVSVVMVRRKSSWIVVPTTETASHVAISMESLKWEESKGVNDEWIQCPVFPLDFLEYPKPAEADRSKLEELTCSRPVTL